MNERRRTVVVVPLSSEARAAPPLTIQVKCAGRKVVAVVDQVRAVSKDRLKQRIEDMAPDQLEALEAGLCEILELD